MSTALTLFDSPQLAIPDHLRDLNDDGNIGDRISVPSLGIEGKTWTISLNGEKMPMMKRDADGDEVPVSIMRVVVLDYQQRRGRAYYPGTYDPAKSTQPTCWSEDGVEPHPDVKEPVCGKCADCPMAAKGSKVTEQGKAAAACAQHRLLAVVPAFKMSMEPLRLKIPVTSDYDKENQNPQWFAFQQYRDFLKSRGVNHTAALVTKLKFDTSVAYPKILFSPDRWIEPDEKAIINPAVKSDHVRSLLDGTWTPAGVNGKRTKPADDEDEADPSEAALQAEARRVAAEREKAAKAKALAEAKAAETAKAEAEAAEKAKAAAAKPATSFVVEDDDDEDAPASARSAKGGKGAAAAAPAAVSDADLPSDVADLLSDWEDD